eukprot:Rmarinus@m.27020
MTCCGLCSPSCLDTIVRPFCPTCITCTPRKTFARASTTTTGTMPSQAKSRLMRPGSVVGMSTCAPASSLAWTCLRLQHTCALPSIQATTQFLTAGIPILVIRSDCPMTSVKTLIWWVRQESSHRLRMRWQTGFACS